MPLEIGDAVKGTGLAGAIAKGKKEVYGKDYSISKDADGVNSLAKCIIEHLLDNLTVTLPAGTAVTVDIGTGKGGTDADAVCTVE